MPDQRTNIQISYLTTFGTFHSVSIVRFGKSQTAATRWLNLEEGKETGRMEGKANYRHREIRTTPNTLHYSKGRRDDYSE